MSCSRNGVHDEGRKVLQMAVACRQCEAAAASAFGVSTGAIRNACRGREREALARACAISLTRSCFGLSSTALAYGFGRHRSSINHALARVDALRSTEPRFDYAIACLERALVDHVAGLTHRPNAGIPTGTRKEIAA